jgi:enoyl-CoA hydratase
VTDDILFERRGAAAIVTFNRPKALNALTLGMFRALDPRIAAWEADPAIGCIIVRGAGGKAFCAGGDVRAIAEGGPGLGGADDLKRVFFREEYRLLRRVHRLKTPYVALQNGITMGGGAGISINGRYCVATDSTVFAMPESGIGLFPDVGASRFLARCPGRIGLFLALTGQRIRAADMVWCGLATHYVPEDRLEALVEALASGEPVGAALAANARDPGPAPLAEDRAVIDRCFGAPSVEEILVALDRERPEWAAILRRMSPTSLAITHRQLLLGAGGLDIEAALALEYRMTQRCMEAHDFFEGVRALLVDKDQNPRWRPARLDEVTKEQIDRYFAPLGANELTFPD